MMISAALRITLVMSASNNYSQDNTSLYNSDYFIGRNGTDLKRLASYNQEIAYLSQFFDNQGIILDVGCSTGEFLASIAWQGEKYGVEISEYASKIAITNGIKLIENIDNVTNKFDVIVYRGTIQHVPNPFEYIDKSYRSLKPGGFIVFLATPNANSAVYKICNTLPALDPKYNYWVPSDITLCDNLNNAGFDVIDVQYPYVGSPYSSYFYDHIMFLRLLLMRRTTRFAFWKNMMNVIARKPDA